ncbi:response regulator transcription factor [Leuconostoc falkenbergense]
MTEQVLIIEDDPEVANLIELALRSSGYKYETAVSARQASSLLPIYKPDLILLDLMLPDSSGFDIITVVRLTETTPIIVISARTEDSDKVLALDSGADDYITKPFSIEELLARVRVAFRNISRSNKYASQLAESKDRPNYVNGDLQINFEAHNVTIAGEDIHLTPMEYGVLEILSQNTTRVLTYHFILKNVWETESINDTSSLRVTIATLRRKLGEKSSSKFIETHVGVGYRMIENSD